MKYNNFAYNYIYHRNYLSFMYVIYQESIPRHMIFKKSLIVIFAGFILCLMPLMIPSCTHDPVGIELLDTVCFAPTIMGILRNSCGSNGTIKCHDGSPWRAVQFMIQPLSWDWLILLVIPGAAHFIR